MQQCGTTCVYCGRELGEPYIAWLDISVDHVISSEAAKKLGYPREWIDDVTNLVTCCLACNGFLSRYPVPDSVPTTREEFFDLRDRHFREKRRWVLRRHEQEQEAYRAWLASRFPASSLPTGVAVAGVDACPGGWVVAHVALDGVATVSVFKRFGEILDLGAGVIAVDIPVGLVDESPREADKAAQLFVGSRRSSVFPTPIRAVLEFDNHADANRRHRELTGKGLSIQSFWLCRRMLEVDAWVKTDERIIEVHPEVSFRELRGEPLRFSKHTPEGLIERRTLLERIGIAIPRRPPRSNEDDLLDAIAAAWSAARYAHGLAQPLPEGHRDRIGAIWC